jgi:hypothetical protein
MADLNVNLTIEGMPGFMAAIRLEVARIIRRMAGDEAPVVAVRLQQIAAVFEAGQVTNELLDASLAREPKPGDLPLLEGCPTDFTITGEFDAAAVEKVHAMFEPGVAYMPVPRCDHCRWWQRDESSSEFGLCNRAYDAATKCRAVHGFGLSVHSSFGCVQWETK